MSIRHDLPLDDERLVWIQKSHEIFGQQQLLMVMEAPVKPDPKQGDDLLALTRRCAAVSTAQSELGPEAAELLEELEEFATDDGLKALAKSVFLRQKGLQKTIVKGLEDSETERQSATDAVSKGQTRFDDDEDASAQIKTATEAVVRAEAAIRSARSAVADLRGAKAWLTRLQDGRAGLADRLVELQGDLLDQLHGRIALLETARVVAPTEDYKTVLQQLVLVTGLSTSKVSSALSKVTNEDTAKVCVEALRKKTTSTGDALKLVSACQTWVADAMRFFGSFKAAKESLDDGLLPTVVKVQAVGSMDMTLALQPYLEVSEEAVKGRDGKLVAVVGGGPVGLMAAIEARLQGAPAVTLFEGRSKGYSRKNVLKLSESTISRFQQVGVWEAMLGEGGSGDRSTKAVPTMNIEMALLTKCELLGVKLLRGWVLDDVEKVEDSGKVALSFSGKDDPVLADLCIVAVGPGIARPRKTDGVLLAEKLEFEFTKQEAKDFAATGILDTTDDRTVGEQVDTHTRRAWAYDFKPRDLQYLVAGLAEEQYAIFAENPALLKAYVERLAKSKGMGTDFLESPQAFPIEIQQSDRFVSSGKKTVLTGDSAATPHPSTAKGLNTGMDEMSAIGDLVRSSMKEGGPTTEDEGAYDWELKQRTDVMVTMALRSMSKDTSMRLTSAVFHLKSAIRKDKATKKALLKAAEAIDTARGPLATATMTELDEEAGGTFPVTNGAIQAFRAAERTADTIAATIRGRLDTEAEITKRDMEGWKAEIDRAAKSLTDLTPT